MKRSTKRKEKATEASVPTKKVSKNDTSSEKYVVLTETEMWELVQVADEIKAVGRLNTKQAFDLGIQLTRAQAILPPKRFGRWLERECGHTTKWAKNYTNVHSYLTPYRERLEKAAVAPTVMFVMAVIEDKSRVEMILDTIERGERVTVDKAKVMAALSKGLKLSVDPLEMPGREGCRKIAEQRLKGNMATFYELLERVFVHVQDAARKFAEGERVVKADLAAAIQHPSRHAHDLFALTMAPYYAAKEDYLNWLPSSIDKSTPWGRFQRALYLLGKKDLWPAREEFRSWIVDEVHPLLRFAILGEALPENAALSAAEGQPAEKFAADAQPPSVTLAVEPQRMVLEAPSLVSEDTVPAETLPSVQETGTATEFQLSESQRERIDAQIEKVAHQFGSDFTPERADELRAALQVGYRQVAELNTEIDAMYPERT